MNNPCRNKKKNTYSVFSICADVDGFLKKKNNNHETYIIPSKSFKKCTFNWIVNNCYLPFELYDTIWKWIKKQKLRTNCNQCNNNSSMHSIFFHSLCQYSVYLIVFFFLLSVPIVLSRILQEKNNRYE